MSNTVRDNPDDHRYELIVDDEVAGFSNYELDGDRITFTHTEVDDAYAGRGPGKELVTGLLSDAEERGLAVVPACSYVRKVIAEDAPRYLHLVPDDVRESLGLAG
jgi:predicted GNAT family acetyltransferase